MASLDDVRRIAQSLPEAVQDESGYAFSVPNRGKYKGFAWVWNERVEPKRPRVPNPDVLAVRVAGQDDKAMLLASDTTKYFTEAHYDGFPAVLVRLSAIEPAELAELLTDAWRCLAPRALVREFDERAASGCDTSAEKRP